MENVMVDDVPERPYYSIMITLNSDNVSLDLYHDFSQKRNIDSNTFCLRSKKLRREVLCADHFVLP
jgi:hypothetical protein